MEWLLYQDLMLPPTVRCRPLEAFLRTVPGYICSFSWRVRYALASIGRFTPYVACLWIVKASCRSGFVLKWSSRHMNWTVKALGSSWRTWGCAVSNGSGYTIISGAWRVSMCYISVVLSPRLLQVSYNIRSWRIEFLVGYPSMLSFCGVRSTGYGSARTMIFRSGIYTSRSAEEGANARLVSWKAGTISSCSPCPRGCIHSFTGVYMLGGLSSSKVAQYVSLPPGF